MSDELTPLPSLPPGMPSPRALTEALTEQLGQHITAARKARGEVHAAEDTFPLVRSMVASHELLADYARSFTTAAKIVTQELESELLDAAGEQDGIPAGGVTVADIEGDIRLTPHFDTEYDIELSTLIAVVISDAIDQVGPANSEAAASDAVETLLSLGSFTPQVSKVKAYAKQLARREQDKAASVVSGTVRKKQTYRGVKAKRKE